MSAGVSSSFSPCQTATSVRISFTRALVTGDASTDVAIGNAALFLLWAYSPVAGYSPSIYGQHTVYGSTYVNLVSAGNVGTPPPTVAPTTPVPTTPGPPTSPPVASNATGYTSPDGVLSVAWTVNASSITFTLVANVTGWVSVGLNPSSGVMAGSDMYVGWVESGTGAVTLVDGWSTGHSTPLPDTLQGGQTDVAGVSGTLVRAVSWMAVCGVVGGGWWWVVGGGWLRGWVVGGWWVVAGVRAGACGCVRVRAGALRALRVLGCVVLRCVALRADRARGGGGVRRRRCRCCAVRRRRRCASASRERW